MSTEYIVTVVNKVTVIEFRIPSLMDPMILEGIGHSLDKLVEEEDRRLLVLDFTRVEFLSSQAIGIVISLHRKLGALPRSKMVLCGINGKLQELLKITRLDKVLTVKKTQNDAVTAMALV
jgi:anti-sigma B factor antagonist